MTIPRAPRVRPTRNRDGCRVRLVDRLWPRTRTENARIEHWLRELAPSNELRKVVSPRPDALGRIPPPLRRRAARPTAAAAALAELHDLIAAHPVLTLLHAARDTTHNNAEALRLWLACGAASRPGNA